MNIMKYISIDSPESSSHSENDGDHDGGDGGDDDHLMMTTFGSRSIAAVARNLDCTEALPVEQGIQQITGP